MFFKGILIGLIFGVPVGAVGAMTVQRTWEHGIKAGLLTGMGSSIADCIYAAIGAFGLTIISDFLLQYQGLFIWWEEPLSCLWESGGNPDLSVCLFLVWYCRGQHKSQWMAGSFGGCFVGTYLWWGGLAAAAALARKKKRTDNLQKMNRIFGAVLSLFGIFQSLPSLYPFKLPERTIRYA